MRLLELNKDGQLSLTKDIVNNELPYAILSHTWGIDDDEVSFKDLTEGSENTKAGYRKLRFCGEQAARDGLQYFWVDTCCIDKSNNTELSEAINSMFRWYRDADKCYVYLSNISTNGQDESLQSWQSTFRESRWFTRGWTLQELIAPRSVEFFCSNGKRLGDKKSLEQQIHEITGIEILALQGTPLSVFSVKERMSWAENRETKREEDKAYSLLGIFDIHMSLIYGEGKNNALRRLEKEIFVHRKKHLRDELSTVSYPTFNSTKRLKILPSQPSSVPSHRDPNSLNSEPLSHSEYSVHDEVREEPLVRLGHSVRATTKQFLIDQLYFTKIDERLTNLTAAQGQTCRWFLTKPEYASWHDPVKQLDHGGFLWIKGNPGTGKSTLMKLLFEAKLNAKGNPSQITLSFFFLARGTVEEKSTIGLYRSLLHQLFERAVELVDSLEWLTIDGARAIQRNGWGEEALKQTLVHAIQRLGSRSLTIFIDALDECDKNQAASMICFLEELCDYAIEAQVKLNICLSSRHYPTVVIQKGIEVTLEDEIGHTEDIKLYIKSKFRLGKSEQAESLRSEILEKSSNIFLWVVLVLDILNSEYPNRAISVKKIRERLKEIPPELNNLFEMILMRDGEDIGQLELCLKWILFATHPLKPQELYFAIQLGIDTDCSGYWDQEDVELDQIKTFVRSSSKGLAEVTRNKASEVQFIHESVRDFLLGKYEAQWSGLSDNFVGYSHEVLRNCCMAQLSASIKQDVDLPDPLPQASKAPQLRENISLKFPFLEYSVSNVLRHADSVQQNGMDQGDFLADFPLQRWTLYNNALERFDVRRYMESVSLLYILAEKNLANLIRIYPQRESCFNIESERYGLPFLAALATGSREAVQVFLDVWAEIHQQVPLLHYLSKLHYENRNKPTKVSRDFTFVRRKSVFASITELCDQVVFAFLCVLGELDLEPKASRSQAPLSQAIGIGHEAVVKLLLEKGAGLEFKDKDGCTPLLWAVLNGHEAVIQLLLENGADLDSKDCRGRIPLSLAAENGRETVVNMLLNTRKVDVDSKDEGGRTPLSWAAEKGHCAVVKMLLDTSKVDIDSKDKEGRTPLSRTVGGGFSSWAKLIREAVVKMLLDTGKVDADSKDESGRTPLSWAAEEGCGDIVKMLLDAGNVDIDSKDEGSRTPLSCAAEKGHWTVVKMLLDAGNVDFDSKDEDGRTPLSWAAEKGHWTVVKTLLDTGKVDFDSKDEGGRTPLSWAAEKRHLTVVKMLLDTGKVEVDSKDKEGRTPLSRTVAGMLPSWPAADHEAVVKMLLDTGKVVVHCKDMDGQTPLSRAEQIMLSKNYTGGDHGLGDYQTQLMLLEQQNKKRLQMARDNTYGGEVAVVLLLASKSVHLNSKDPNGRTLLSWAAEGGMKTVAEMLLDTGKVDVDSKDKGGRTPLSWAAERAAEAGCEGVVKMLLDTDKVDVE